MAAGISKKYISKKIREAGFSIFFAFFNKKTRIIVFSIIIELFSIYNII
jgi:hypothetical protein